MLQNASARIARFAIPVALITASLAIAQPAAATDLCVNTTCGGVSTPNLETALTLAAAAPDHDRIFLGAGTYTPSTPLGFEYSGNGPVDIIGAGAGQTILTASGPVSTVLWLVGGGGSTVSDLSIEIPVPNSGSIGLVTSGVARRIAITNSAPPTGDETGVRLIFGGAIEDSSVSLGTNQFTVAVNIADSTPGAVRGSTLYAQRGVWAEGGGTIERSFITATEAGVVADRPTSVTQSVIHITSAIGNGIYMWPAAGVHGTLDVDGVTLQGGLFGSAWGIRAASNFDPTDVTVRNTYVRGFDHPLEIESLGPATATMTATYSDFDAGKSDKLGANAVLNQANNSFVANPGFINPINANYHLRADSPLIDAGDPATAQSTDLDGNPLVTDGNHDGTARRDIGAYEVDGPLPVELTPAPTGGDEPPADPPATPVAPAPTLDRLAPTITGFVSTNKVFAVGHARTAISARARGTRLRYKLSEPAKVTITIKRDRRGARSAGKLKRTGATGWNAIKFSGRIGSHALPRGRYIAAITAVDLAGNRSAPKKLRFRVV